MEHLIAAVEKLAQAVGEEDSVRSDLRKAQKYLGSSSSAESLSHGSQSSHKSKSDQDKILKKVNSRLRDFEQDMMERLESVKGGDGDLKEEVSKIKNVVLGCEEDMTKFTEALDVVNQDLDESRARIENISSRHAAQPQQNKFSDTNVTNDISMLKMDISDIQEALRHHDHWMQDASSKLSQTHETVQRTLRNSGGSLNNNGAGSSSAQVQDCLDGVESCEAGIQDLRDQFNQLKSEKNKKGKDGELTSKLLHDFSALENKIIKAHEELSSETDLAITALNGRIDFTNKDLGTTQESINEIQSSISDCFNEVGMVTSDMRNHVADIDHNIRNDVRQSIQEVQEKMVSLESRNEMQNEEQSRRMGALDLRMSGVQGGISEHKRDLQRLRTETTDGQQRLDVLESSLNQNENLIRKIDKQLQIDDLNIKDQLSNFNSAIEDKVNCAAFEENLQLLASLTRGMSKMAQVIGLFPGPRFSDEDGFGDSNGIPLDGDADGLGWEETCETFSMRIDKAWRQRCSQRYRNVLDMISKKADHSVLRLLQISQQHFETQLERFKQQQERDSMLNTKYNTKQDLNITNQIGALREPPSSVLSRAMAGQQSSADVQCPQPDSNPAAPTRRYIRPVTSHCPIRS